MFTPNNYFTVKLLLWGTYVEDINLSICVSILKCGPALIYIFKIVSCSSIIIGVLETINTSNLQDALLLRKAQPNRPVFCTEAYPGWYDNWGNQKHQTRSIKNFENMLTDLLYKGDMDVNIYMFFGGTNFGWQAGGEGSRGPVTTSYDYDGVLSEAGESIVEKTKVQTVQKINICLDR